MLDQRRDANGGVPDPLPVDAGDRLRARHPPAFAYLHRSGLLYCDFKPDNVMHTGDTVRSSSTSGPRTASTSRHALYGTPGYQAPEIAARAERRQRPLHRRSHARSRCCTATPRYSSTSTRCPTPRTSRSSAAYESLYRLLLRATALDPDERFQSADEMAAQLHRRAPRGGGARDRHVAARRRASCFAVELRSATAGPDGRAAPGDPGVGRRSRRRLPRVAAHGTPARRRHRTLAGSGATARSGSARRAAADRAERADEAAACSRSSRPLDPWEWRVAGTAGSLDLQRGDPRRAVEFHASTATVPGELAPKLALAFALELADDDEPGRAWYETVARTDPGVHVGVRSVSPLPVRLRRPRRCGRGATTGCPLRRARSSTAQMAKADMMLRRRRARGHRRGARGGRRGGHRALPRGGPGRASTRGVFDVALEWCSDRAKVRRVDPDNRARARVHRDRAPVRARAAYRGLARFAPAGRASGSSWSTGPTPRDPGRCRERFAARRRCPRCAITFAARRRPLLRGVRDPPRGRAVTRGVPRPS